MIRLLDFIKIALKILHNIYKTKEECLFQHINFKLITLWKLQLFKLNYDHRELDAANQLSRQLANNDEKTMILNLDFQFSCKMLDP